MKKSVKLIALICALLMLVSLAACGEKSDDKKDDSSSGTGTAIVSATESGLTDFDWVKFEVPAGFSDTKESDYYIAFADDADDKRGFHVSKRTLFSDKTIEDAAADETEYSKNAEIGEAIELGGRSWIPVHFDFNDTPSVYLFTQLDDGHYCYIVSYKMIETDEPIQTLVNSMEFDLTKLD